jgi:hypothetical protein
LLVWSCRRHAGTLLCFLATMRFNLSPLTPIKAILHV